MTDHYRAVVLRRAVECALGGVEGLDALVTEDVAVWTPNMVARSREELLESVLAQDDVLTEAEVVIDALDIIGDKGIAEWRASATFSLPLLLDEDILIEATGSRVTLAGVTVAEFRDQQICAFRFYFDDAALLEQMLSRPTDAESTDMTERQRIRAPQHHRPMRVMTIAGGQPYGGRHEDHTLDDRPTDGEAEAAVDIGPVEYLIIGFPGNRFNGAIVPELAKLLDAGTIRLLDLVFIMKDQDGNVALVEFDEHEDLVAFTSLDGEIGGFIGDEDVQHAAEDLEPNSSAALLVWEDTWATPLVTAMRQSGGVLIEGSRIPHDLIEEVVAELSSATS